MLKSVIKAKIENKETYSSKNVDINTVYSGSNGRYKEYIIGRCSFGSNALIITGLKPPNRFIHMEALGAASVV